jgi:catechol 2,3-dioxygenase-like lactoylglutathione lyase family enzyme
MGLGRFSGVALECRDPHTLAAFYAALTGWTVVYESDTWLALGPSADADWHLSFQLAPGHEPPTWPDHASSMQAHLHFRVDDAAAAEAYVLGNGGVKLAEAVYADPAGHPFCLVSPPRPPAA